MPRKAAAAAGEDAPEPRRSSRIKVQPTKPESEKKAPAKPRAKKADKEDADQEEKPKSARGTKRKAVDEPNGAGEASEEPKAKKVSFFLCAFAALLTSETFGTRGSGQTRI